MPITIDEIDADPEPRPDGDRAQRDRAATEALIHAAAERALALAALARERDRRLAPP